MRHPSSSYCLFVLLTVPILPTPVPWISSPHVLAGQAPAENVKRFISVADSVVALTHVRVVDGTGAEPLEDQTILISGGKIAAIQPAGSGQLPNGAKAIDLKGHTVIPGIVGLHNHTFYTTNLRSVQSNGTAPLL